MKGQSKVSSFYGVCGSCGDPITGGSFYYRDDDLGLICEDCKVEINAEVGPECFAEILYGKLAGLPPIERLLYEASRPGSFVGSEADFQGDSNA